MKTTKLMVLMVLAVGMASLGAAELKEFDGFEDGDFISNPVWEETSTAATATVQSTTVKNGFNALEISDADNSNYVLNHDRGASDTISDGDQYQIWMRQDVTDNNQYLFLSNTKGSRNGNDAIYIGMTAGGDWTLTSWDSSGNFINQQNSGSYSANTWYRAVLTLNPSSSTATLEVYDTNGNLVTSIVGQTSSGATNIQHVGIENGGGSPNTAYYDDVSYSIQSNNQAPQFDSTSVSPDPPLIGENVSYGANVSDSDGTIDYTNLTVTYGSNTVVDDEQRSSTNLPNWTNIYKPVTGDKWLNATFETVDDAGAVTTQELNRFLDDTRPGFQINDPENITYFSYSNPYAVKVNDDNDSNANETVTCDLYNDGNLIRTDSITEGTGSFTGTLQNDAGGPYEFKASCDDGEGALNKSTFFTVKRVEFQSVSAANPVFETQNRTFTGNVKVGDMVNELTTSLYWNNTVEAVVDPSNTGINTYNQKHYFEIPLVQNNNTAVNWLIQADINYTDFNASTTSLDSLNSSTQTQDVYHAVSFENQTLDKSDYLEFDNIEYTSYLRNHTDNFGVDAEIYLNQSDTTENLPKVKGLTNYQKYQQNVRSGEVESSNPNTPASDAAKINTTYTISFKGDTREIVPADLTTTVQRLVIASCGGSVTTNALTFTTYDEENRTTEVTSDFYGSWSAWNPEYPNFKRSFNFTSLGTSTHEFCISPSDETFVIDNTNNKKITYEADNYSTRSRYLIEEEISNATNNIPLYLLSLSDSSEIELEVVDDQDNQVSKVIIESLRYFPGEDKFLTVAMSRTGEQGSSRTYLKFNDIDYKFKLYQDGELVKETDQQVLPQDLSLRFVLGDEQLPGYYDQVDNVDFGCNSNKTEIRCSYSGPDSLETTTLEVQKDEAIGFAEEDDPDTQTVEYCKKSSTSSSAVLICDGLNTTQNRYKYELSTQFNSGDDLLLDSGWLGELTSELYGETGLMIYLMVFITTGFAGLWKPEAAIALGMFATIISYFIGFLVVSNTALMSFIALGIVTIWRMS